MLSIQRFPVLLLFALSACARPPGATNEELMTRYYTSAQDYKVVATCIAAGFDTNLKFGYPAVAAKNSLRIVEGVGKASVVTKIGSQSVLLANLAKTGRSSSITLLTSNDQRAEYTYGVLGQADAAVKACL